MIACSRAIVPSTVPVQLAGTTAGASHELNEPPLDAYGGARSVWYSWTPAVAGTYTVSTSGSSFNSLLAVYGDTNALLTGLTAVRVASWQFAAAGFVDAFDASAAVRVLVRRLADPVRDQSSAALLLVVN